MQSTEILEVKTIKIGDTVKTKSGRIGKVDGFGRFDALVVIIDGKPEQFRGKELELYNTQTKLNDNK